VKARRNPTHSGRGCQRILCAKKPLGRKAFRRSWRVFLFGRTALPPSKMEFSDGICTKHAARWGRFGRDCRRSPGRCRRRFSGGSIPPMPKLLAINSEFDRLWPRAWELNGQAGYAAHAADRKVEELVGWPEVGGPKPEAKNGGRRSARSGARPAPTTSSP